jgi:hypothetical protein
MKSTLVDNKTGRAVLTAVSMHVLLSMQRFKNVTLWLCYSSLSNIDDNMPKNTKNLLSIMFQSNNHSSCIRIFVKLSTIRHFDRTRSCCLVTTRA